MSVEKHMAVAKYFLTTVNAGEYADFSRWDEIVHSDYSPGEIPEKMTQDTKKGREEFRQRIAHTNSCIPDLKYVIISIIAQNDEVFVHHDVYASNKGGLYNLPTSDNQAKFLGFHRFKFKDNKIIKLWLVFDTFKAFSDWGQAIFEKNDNEELAKYMKSLVVSGLLPKSTKY